MSEEKHVDDSVTLFRDELMAIVRDNIEVFAEAIVLEIATRLKGERVPAPDAAARDAAIRREFNGKNTKEMMIKYGVSRSTLYNIIA